MLQQCYCADLEEFVQQRSLHGLGTGAAAEALLEDGLPRAPEAARHARPRQQHVWLQNKEPCARACELVNNQMRIANRKRVKQMQRPPVASTNNSSSDLGNHRPAHACDILHASAATFKASIAARQAVHQRPWHACCSLAVCYSL